MAVGRGKFWDSFLRSVAIGCFLFYVFWNSWWLAQGMIPPSLALALFGIPAPTTGMTRAAAALVAGDLSGSLYWNAFLVPVLVLLVLSPAVLMLRGLQKKKIVLPRALAAAWLIVLVVAWIIKLA